MPPTATHQQDNSLESLYTLRVTPWAVPKKSGHVVYGAILFPRLLMLKGPFTLGGILSGISRGIPLVQSAIFIFACVWHPSGTALDRFGSDFPAGYRSPAVLLTNQRFCFVVVMPLPVTALAGSDAYLGHQKAKCRRVCKFSGTSDRLSELRHLFSYRTASVLTEYGQTVPATFEETVVVTMQFTHECVEFSTVIPRLQCLVHPDTSLASILSPLSPSHHQQKQQKISHVPPSII